MRSTHNTEDLKFGRFQLRRGHRQLLTDGVPVELGARALDVLLALIDADGAPLNKDELLSRVWPGMAVEEHNLTVQIHALRKALGDDRDLIRTVPRYGYSFTGSVEPLPTLTSPNVETVIAVPRPLSATKIVTPVEPLIGRDDEVQELLDLLTRCRLLTLTGPGGIGKTRLALEVARRLLPSFEDGVWLAELAPLSDAALVPVTIASAFGIQLSPRVPPNEAVAAALAGKNFLLVLDNCEHVVADAARASEMLLRTSAGGRILATSREPLRAVGESVYRVPALAAPDPHATDTDAILAHGAVQLFIARARAADTRFCAADTELPTIATICRRLDGMPLAIELAATLAPALGVGQLLGGLDNRLGLLTGGRRTALPRHQTLRATLDWSHDLLTETERKVLRRLAVFVGGFTLSAAGAVVSDAVTTGINGVETVADLLDKSLIVASHDSPEQRFRMLEMTRAYALAKLQEAGEGDAIARRHAEFFCAKFYRNFCAPAMTGSGRLPTIADMAAYSREIDNVRSALDWAFSPGGDSAVGINLTAAFAPVWLHLSLLAEYQERAQRALDALGPAMDRRTRPIFQLYISLGVALHETSGSADACGAAITKALEIAESLNDAECELHALRGMFAYQNSSGNQRAARNIAERFVALASRKGDQPQMRVGDWLTALAMHYGGNQVMARHYAERAIDLMTPPSGRQQAAGLLNNAQVQGRALLARVLWLQGFADQARHTAQSSLEYASAIEHKTSVCLALGVAVCPIALSVGNFDTAERSVAMLIDIATRYNSSFWTNLGPGLQGALLAGRGEIAAGTKLLLGAYNTFRAIGLASHFSGFLGVLAEGLAAVGQRSEASTIITEAIGRSTRYGELWYLPELVRIKGQLLLQDRPAQPVAAEARFKEALVTAREQGALFWELRAALSLARLFIEQYRRNEVQQILAPVYERFAEGFDTTDLKYARAILELS